MKVLDLLFPPRCIFCGEVSEEGAALCRRCRRKTKLRENPLPALTASNCRVSWVITPYHYYGGVRRGVQQFKFHGDLRARDHFAAMIVREIERCGLRRGIELVTFVPMTPAKEKQRGYNQAHLLAQSVAEGLSLPLRGDLLTRSGMLPQHQLTAGFRARSASASFALAPEAELPPSGILLVDDIITTGSTVARCAELLLQAGAREVFAAAAAS